MRVARIANQNTGEISAARSTSVIDGGKRLC
jgi:hypothetical protein